MSQHDAGAQLHLERQHGPQLRLGEAADIVLAVVGILNRLLRQPGDGFVDLASLKPEAGRIPLIELPAVPANGVHAVPL